MERIRGAKWDKSSKEGIEALQEGCRVPMNPQGNAFERKKKKKDAGQELNRDGVSK